MSEPFIGEIKIFAGNFAPRGYALCDGQLLAISQNQALFALLGTIYGGDGRTTFQLPDMRGRVPVHQGQGPGLTRRDIGRNAGTETHALSPQELGSHDHAFPASTAPATDTSPAGTVPATAFANLYGPAAGATSVDLAAETVKPAGQPSPTGHNNVMPFQCVNFIIALIGVFPSRN